MSIVCFAEPMVRSRGTWSRPIRALRSCSGPRSYRPPAIITLCVLAWRFVSGLVRLLYRHPIAVHAYLAPVAATLRYGWVFTAWCFGCVVLALVVWAFAHRPSFCLVVGWRLLAYWRLIANYRRHWSFAMSGAGLSRMDKALEYRPRLVKVVCGPVADVVTVKMLKGQSPELWRDRSDNLAHAFGSASCRVSIVRAGVLRLTFPRRDLLASPIPALPIPATVDLAAVPIGLCEDGKPWTLKVHGTHVLVAGATGAGKGSIIWSTVRGLLPAIRAEPGRGHRPGPQADGAVLRARHLPPLRLLSGGLRRRAGRGGHAHAGPGGPVRLAMSARTRSRWSTRSSWSSWMRSPS
ncbi:hypothetical protein ACFSTC_11565 [Nonomuraea ferruginea]